MEIFVETQKKCIELYMNKVNGNISEEAYQLKKKIVLAELKTPYNVSTKYKRKHIFAKKEKDCLVSTITEYVGLDEITDSEAKLRNFLERFCAEADKEGVTVFYKFRENSLCIECEITMVLEKY